MSRELENFDPERIKWATWQEQFEEFIITKGVNCFLSPREKLAHLKVKGGSKLTEILNQLDPDKSNTDVYDEAVKRLTKYFEQKRNPVAEIMKFRSIKQRDGERAKQFLMRLKLQADLCDYSKESKEQEILTQFVQGVNDQMVRNKYVRKELATMDELVQEAELNETTAAQRFELPSASEINAVHQSRAASKVNPMEDVTCYKCGKKGHYASAHYTRPVPYDKGRSGRGLRPTFSGGNQSRVDTRQCFNCNGFGHIARYCTLNRRNDRVAYVHQENSNPEPRDEYLFFLGNDETIACNVGGVKIDMVLDTGCQSNIITEPVWTLMKAQGVKVSNSTKTVDKTFKAFGQTTPFNALGSFEATVKVDGKEGNAKFYVLNVKDRCLLGAETAKELGLLQFNVSQKN